MFLNGKFHHFVICRMLVQTRTPQDRLKLTTLR
jgi:hypothetical protein